MPPPRPQKTSTTKLPHKLLEELQLRHPSRGGGGGKSQRRPQPLDRKTRRKQERAQKSQSSRQASAQHRAPRGRGGGSQLLDEDDSDDDEPAPAPKRERRPSPPPPPVKSILKKSKKRPAEFDENEEEEGARPAKKPGLRKAVRDKLAQDEAEIAYLERKLKIKDKKLPKGFEEEGLDWLLDGLKDDYLDDRQERAAKANKRARASPEEDGEDGEESGSGFGSGDDEEGDEDELGDLEDDESEKDGANKSDEEFAGFSDEETPPEPSSKPVRQDPTKPFVPSGKYVPPSLRKPATTASASDSEDLTRLRRQAQGLLNRLSEANLLNILSEIESLYRTNARGHVTSVLCDIILGSVTDRAALLDTFVILHAGFVAGIYKLVGTDFGAHIVQRIVELFDSYHEAANKVDPAVAGKECTNIMSFLSELYNFGVVGAVLVLDFAREFLTDITELHTELLLKIVRNSGTELRSDDPAALRDLIGMMQTSIARAGADTLSVRTKFMVETLTDLKNNRVRKDAAASSAVRAEHTVRMKRVLGSLNSRRLRAAEPLRPALADIRGADAKGKWWLVGASWVGPTTTDSTATDTTAEAPTAEPTYAADDDDGEVDLQALARAHRMNTDVRRAIFTTLLSAADCTDAHTRLLKLRLKRAQQPEVARVLLHCAAAEATPNPYYAALARRLCGAHHHSRMAFTFALWEYFRRFGEEGGTGTSADDNDGEDGDREWASLTALRKVVNLAKLYAALLASGALGVNVFKTLDFALLQRPTRSFLDVFWAAALADMDEKKVMEAVKKTEEKPELARGLLLWFRSALKGGMISAAAADDKECRKVERNAKAAVRTLKDVVQNTVVEAA